jgi:trans-2,3-dihydro-3-hydroxyanthranilate isomerase
MTMKRTFPFVQVDVFTATPLEGNQLAVLTDARGLSDTEMQALAREMNLSETTFVFPREAAVERERGVQVRIFTVDEELPFAGHPTLGTAYVLRGQSERETIELELKVGKIPVRFSQREGLLFGEMTQVDPTFGKRHEPEAVAQATGLNLSDIDPSAPIETVSTGNAFAMVPVRNLKVLRRLSLNWRTAEEYLRRTDAKFFYFVCRETEHAEARLQARMFFYNGEDPATGSAAGPCAAWMVRYGIAQPEEQVLIEQGLEMRRPSRIWVRAGKHDDSVVNVRVGGNCAEVLRGEVFL